MEHWIKIDIQQNWATSIRQVPPLAGIEGEHDKLFSAVKPGDILWFYAIKPVRGVVGFAKIAKKYRDDKTRVFIEELRSQKVIMPLRFSLKDVKSYKLGTWTDNHINIGDFKLNWMVRFQPLLDNHSKKLIHRVEMKFRIDFKDYLKGILNEMS